jgi:hypothetical protein
MLQVGDRVNRIEDRHIVGATVLEVVESSSSVDDCDCHVLIAYDEGEQGWWPSNALELIEEGEEQGEGQGEEQGDDYLEGEQE